ncbi:MAG: ABC-F family ATP-binding cassette domain-containing protein [Muribaculaceae bacterium]|jgi:ATP-binding cassette subfamily F protein uup|uniref:ABC-F family ATP-binding cassette domain-containing protein n=1 Tax=Sangeribacter muris TaxID=2880703 RepID=UPI001A2B58A8|nr:ABC-F family ATP-binding cassette domain-containing protein [Sangeribacter muris]MBJ2193242.1 ABC-F family ATP-binding cassette domain-containing protein [Muribaculaceae bacterium]MCX4280530.1 ABC-F family ATP-binding cassette domain-containing protein [Muribaculaceae bacterium]
MILLQIEQLTKSFGDRILFEDVSLGVFQGDKIGIVAQNGAGKTTFLNILAGREDYDSGKVTFRNGIRVGYLEQIPPMDQNMTALEYASLDVRDNEEGNGVDLARQMLTQFKITDYVTPLGRMSGGQTKRAALARVLLSKPDMLILDEPTNHLDIDMIEWLEAYLSRQKMTLLMVTHDRYFLDKVCNKIIEIDRTHVYSYDGNYDYYLRKRDERHENLSAELAKVRNLLRTELEWMRRQPQARGSKAKYRIDNFHELEKKSKVNLTERNVSLNVKSSYIGSKIFEAHNVVKAFGEKRILNGWSYTFARYEKVGIVGDNGAGKSTFIKLLLGLMQPDSGHFDIGETVKWGYYSQEGMTDFDEQKKVIDAVREIAEEVRIDDKTRLSASQFLSHFLFTPETQQKFIHKLSGGERRRLYLATVLMRNPNFLILDEPTNDLDIMTLAVLEDYLVNFKGCVIVVSHDRFFLDRIVDHLFVFKGDGEVRDFPGDYSTYRHCVAEEEKERRAAEKPKEKVKASWRPAEEKRKLTFKEKREMESLEKEIEELTAERATLETSLSTGGLDSAGIITAGERLAAVVERLDEAELRLLELMDI